MMKNRSIQPIMNALLVFDCAARTLSFSAAARALGTSQPSVSRHISNLEAHLRCRLFQRLNNKITLTTEGRKLHNATISGFETLSGTVAEIISGRAVRTVTIGCTHGFSHLWIMPRFSSLTSSVPDRNIRILTSDSNNDHDFEDVDFSIQFHAEGSLPPHGTHLFDEDVVLVASPKFIAENHLPPRVGTIEWLLRMPLIHLDGGEEMWMSWKEWFASHGVHYRPPVDTYFYHNYAFSLQAAAEGKGIALSWKGLLGSYQENGWLDILGLASIKTRGSYRLVYNEDWEHDASGVQIISWFQSQVGKDP